MLHVGMRLVQQKGFPITPTQSTTHIKTHVLPSRHCISAGQVKDPDAAIVGLSDAAPARLLATLAYRSSLNTRRLLRVSMTVEQPRRISAVLLEACSTEGPKRPWLSASLAVEAFELGAKR